MSKKSQSNLAVSAILTVIILIGVGIFITILFNQTEKETEVNIMQDKIEIKAQFGTTINIKDITDIKLVDKIPEVETKVNGAGLGEYKRGDFEVKQLGRCKMYVDGNEGPFIYIVEGSKYTIINYKDAAKTKSTYQKLEDIISK